MLPLYFISLNAQSWRNYRFKSLGTSLEQTEINNYCQSQGFSSNISSYWSIYSTSPLIVGEIYQLLYEGDELRYYYLEQIIYSNIYDVNTANEEDVLGPILVSCPDSDGDGVPNNLDQCPYEAGPSSNYGCPEYPSLQKTTYQLYNKTTEEIVYDNGDGDPNNNSTPWVLRNNEYRVRFRFKNVGAGRFLNGDMVMHWSNDSQYYNSDYDCELDYAIIGSVEPNNESYVDFTFGVNVFNQICYDNRYVTNGKTYYLLFRIINSDQIGDGVLGVLKLKYSTADVASKSPIEPYQLQSFDFSGNQVLSKEVKNKEEEEQAIQSLPKGNYIIKSNNETYKVSKD
ncbi:thrombospondin type 3 repeat-containing protein [Galbibacter mesophilus]